MKTELAEGYNLYHCVVMVDLSQEPYGTKTITCIVLATTHTEARMLVEKHRTDEYCNPFIRDIKVIDRLDRPYILNDSL